MAWQSLDLLRLQILKDLIGTVDDDVDRAVAGEAFRNPNDGFVIQTASAITHADVLDPDGGPRVPSRGIESFAKPFRLAEVLAQALAIAFRA